MSARGVQRIQDSVHGLMEFRDMETLVVELLRTPELQRLRKVRQLGLVHYVFPGAEHSRLSHSLGAAHLAIRFGHQVRHEARRHLSRSLVPDEHAITDLAVAALCHDLGHGPFSHAWEREIVGEHFDRAAWGRKLGLDEGDPVLKSGKWHEIVGHGFLAWPEGQLHRLLEHHERDTAQRIRRLLSGEYYYPYLPRLLSSDVDVDRADFIMRDTHNTGVAYGRFDLNWLLSTCTLGSARGNWVVGFDRQKAVRVIEQFLIARQAMYDTVYHHKTVRCMEGMVGLLLRRLKQISPPLIPQAQLLEPIVRILRGEAIGQSDLLRLDDFTVFVLIDVASTGAFKDDTAQDLARRLRARDLFKRVPVSTRKLTSFLSVPGNSEKLSNAVKPHVPGDPNFYILTDQTEFRLLSDAVQQQAMVVASDGTAAPITEHDVLREYRRMDSAQTRLYTVGPAVDALRRIVGT